MNFSKAAKETTNANVILSNGGRPNDGFVWVSWRCLKNGKPSGKTFSKRFETEAEAEEFYNAKG